MQFRLSIRQLAKAGDSCPHLLQMGWATRALGQVRLKGRAIHRREFVFEIVCNRLYKLFARNPIHPGAMKIGF